MIFILVALALYVGYVLGRLNFVGKQDKMIEILEQEKFQLTVELAKRIKNH